MPIDDFENMADGLTSPAQDAFPVTPSDSNELNKVTKALYIGEGGDVMLRSVRGEQDTLFRNVPAGAILDVRVIAVRATGTSATGIVGLA
jgi:hypothetical protein